MLFCQFDSVKHIDNNFENEIRLLDRIQFWRTHNVVWICAKMDFYRILFDFLLISRLCFVLFTFVSLKNIVLRSIQSIQYIFNSLFYFYTYNHISTNFLLLFSYLYLSMVRKMEICELIYLLIHFDFQFHTPNNSEIWFWLSKFFVFYSKENENKATEHLKYHIHIAYWVECAVEL